MPSSPPGWHYMFLVGNPLTIFICHWHPGGVDTTHISSLRRFWCFCCVSCVGVGLCKNFDLYQDSSFNTAIFSKTIFSCSICVLYKTLFPSKSCIWNRSHLRANRKKNLATTSNPFWIFYNNFYQKCIQRCSISRKNGTPGYISTGKPSHHLQV